ncbi:MAG TPA: arsenite efflux transporter metallochaperone ArsD [Anaeromyxobacteraceae bacterium]|nr:arsenite efflux transporter metallochaperone ArsD [Anaeromyxobacteraceae bacterium]
MPKVQVFDPPMCCSTGVCGPEVDPALTRFASDLEWLKDNGVDVERFNLAQDPGAFVTNPVVSDAIRGRDDALPLLLVDGKIASTGAYPQRDALAALVGVALEQSQQSSGSVVPEKARRTCCPPAGEAPVKLSVPASAAPTKCCP